MYLLNQESIFLAPIFACFKNWVVYIPLFMESILKTTLTRLMLA